MPETLTEEELAQLMADAPGEDPPTSPGAPVVGYRYIRPLAEAADDYIEMLRNEEGRWMFGIRPLDVMIRGVGRGELMYITGRAHMGKTQLMLQSIANHPDKRVILFTPDEVDVLVLSKLISMTRGMPADELEKRIVEGHQATIEMVKRVATEGFPNLIVQHDSLHLDQMAVVVDEASLMLGGPPDVVMVDFLELLPGEGGYLGVSEKSQSLKRWAKDNDVPVVCLHQASRGSSKRGVSGGMDSMKMAGETEAMYLLEVFRKREDESLTEQEQLNHAETLTVAVHKNKRPPCHKGTVDLHVHPEVGQVRELDETID